MSNRWLTVYSFLLTGALLGIVMMGAAKPNSPSFDQITVHRINVVEPDGTVRMVIASNAALPGLIVHGKEQPFKRPQAGILFYNDDASEIGGLIFGGHKNASGEVVDSGGSLSFDKYEANQIVQLAGVDDKDDRFSGMIISDSPRASESHRRVWVGRDEAGTASVSLMDAKGRKRIVMQVLQDGSPSIAFLDQNGEVINSISPTTSQ
jgi:hypothetical protein